jgi:hypothetical protein
VKPLKPGEQYHHPALPKDSHVPWHHLMTTTATTTTTVAAASSTRTTTNMKATGQQREGVGSGGSGSSRSSRSWLAEYDRLSHQNQLLESLVRDGGGKI